MSNDYESFKLKSVAILDLTFYTYLILALVGGAFYFAVLPQNIQNVLPLILLMFFVYINWIIRIKIKSSTFEQYKEIKQILIQWFIITIIFIVFTIIVVLIYPIS